MNLEIRSEDVFSALAAGFPPFPPDDDDTDDEYVEEDIFRGDR